MRRDVRLSAQADSNTYNSEGNSASRKNKLQLSQCGRIFKHTMHKMLSYVCFQNSRRKSIWVFFENNCHHCLISQSQWTPVTRDHINSAASKIRYAFTSLHTPEYPHQHTHTHGYSADCVKSHQARVQKRNRSIEVVQIQRRNQVEKINYEVKKPALFKVELKFAYEKCLRKRCCYKQTRSIFAFSQILFVPASNFVFHHQISVFIFLVREVFGCWESICVLCFRAVQH